MIVIFDTNAYIGLSYDKLNNLKEKEKENGIEVKLCTTVAAELIYHLTYNDDKKKRAFWALKRMSEHCNCVSEKWAPLPEAQIAKEYFSNDNNKIIEIQKIIDIIVSDIKNYNEVDTFISKYCQYITKIKSLIDDVEKVFVNAINSYKKEYENDKVGFIEAIAHEHLLEVAKQIGVSENCVINQMVACYVTNYKTQLELWCNLLEKMIDDDNFNPEERSNHIWDSRILFLYGGLCKGKKVILVSSEKVFYELVSDNGNLKKLSKYLDELNVN